VTARHSDDRTREAFWARSAPAQGTDCPAAERLWDAAHGGLARRDLEVVVEHVAGCGACAEAWRLALELRDEVAQPPATSPPAWHRWLPLAAAAGLLLAVGLLFRPVLQAPEPGYREPNGSTVRSLVAEERPLARDHFELRWSAGPPGARYDVSVTDEGFTEVMRVRGLAEPRLLVPGSALADLPPGARVLWQVRMALPDGEVRRSATFFARVE
jgi:hypothetical protein